jgi:nitrate reductase NapD
MSGVEIHAASWEGRLVVSIESADDQDTASVFESIQMLDGVLSVSLVYSQFESDPDSAIPVASCPLATPY